MIVRLFWMIDNIKNYEKDNFKFCFCWFSYDSHISMQFVKKHGWVFRQHNNGFDNNGANGYNIQINARHDNKNAT
ncbi:hypothetical protein SAMN04488511_1201 [Pedobacter suwonensis]|uniref:Uncharacterized protein n=1 Tax=Pedobacter suwonensis TaxID=332999 RepID=A0A1I0U3Q1_9SPHI|nr:hypothetical protein SAMN04488511_1201 [Pedobacter suwonensis]